MVLPGGPGGRVGMRRPSFYIYEAAVPTAASLFFVLELSANFCLLEKIIPLCKQVLIGHVFPVFEYSPSTVCIRV